MDALGGRRTNVRKSVADAGEVGLSHLGPRKRDTKCDAPLACRTFAKWLSEKGIQRRGTFGCQRWKCDARMRLTSRTNVPNVAAHTAPL
jgi:hypothetical protein